MIRLLLIALLLASPSAASAQARREPPIDQCASDRSFVAFRSQLRAAVARRDLPFVLSIVSDDIESSFGGDPGRADFLAHWQLDRPATSPFWRELAAALRLGCARLEDGSFWAPSISANWDPEEDDFTPTFVAIVTGAALRAAASDDSRVVATLAWDVLTAPANDGESAWLAARLADGRQGYVRRSQVRDLADYRAVFERRGGRWRMTAFVAGD